MSTSPVAMVATSPASTTTRQLLATTISRRRSTRSATTPAKRPKSIIGRNSRVHAEATSSGSRVSEATSSGPAATMMPSPMLEIQLDATSQRKDRPNRDGSAVSSRWVVTTDDRRRA